MHIFTQESARENENYAAYTVEILDWAGDIYEFGKYFYGWNNGKIGIMSYTIYHRCDEITEQEFNTGVMENIVKTVKYMIVEKDELVFTLNFKMNEFRRAVLKYLLANSKVELFTIESK